MSGYDLNELRDKLAPENGKRYWRSLGELADSDEFRNFVESEFPEPAELLDTPVTRRGFLKVMGASLALAGLNSCTREPTEKIFPYVRQPEEIVPGKPMYFATAFALSGVATGEFKIELCKEHDCLCGDEGRELIAQDVAEGANSIVVAACSPRFMADAFTFDNVLTTRVNLREQVVWSHEPNDEDTDMMAQDYLRMGIVRGQQANLSEPLQEEVDRTVLVVGGGVTGLTAALDAAAVGNDVC